MVNMTPCTPTGIFRLWLPNHPLARQATPMFILISFVVIIATMVIHNADKEQVSASVISSRAPTMPSSMDLAIQTSHPISLIRRITTANPAISAPGTLETFSGITHSTGLSRTLTAAPTAVILSMDPSATNMSVSPWSYDTGRPIAVTISPSSNIPKTVTNTQSSKTITTIVPPSVRPRTTTAPSSSFPSYTTFDPSIKPSAVYVFPSSNPSIVATSPPPTLTTFCVIADVPYTDREFIELEDQFLNDTPEDCEFMIHLGDIKNSTTSCNDERYNRVEQLFRKSPIPMFVIVGDNEWNDCPKGTAQEGWNNWNKYFLGYDSKHWTHDLNVRRHSSRPEQFSFVLKRTLFIGLNLVGGKVLDQYSWDRRLSANLEWTKELVRQYVPLEASGVVILAHAKPSPDQDNFLNPMADLIKVELEEKVPFLYLHGDGHAWVYSPGYFNSSQYLRIQHKGGTSQPILKMYSDPKRYPANIRQAFGVDRRISETAV